MIFRMMVQAGLVFAVSVLIGCNSTESEKAAPDPAFDSVRMDSAFFGTWSGSVYVPANGQTQPVEFTLGALAASGYNFTASCTADLTPVKAQPGKAYYDVVLHSGTCVPGCADGIHFAEPDFTGHPHALSDRARQRLGNNLDGVRDTDEKIGYGR